MLRLGLQLHCLLGEPLFEASPCLLGRLRRTGLRLGMDLDNLLLLQPPAAQELGLNALQVFELKLAHVLADFLSRQLHSPGTEVDEAVQRRARGHEAEGREWDPTHLLRQALDPQWRLLLHGLGQRCPRAGARRDGRVPLRRRRRRQRGGLASSLAPVLHGDGDRRVAVHQQCQNQRHGDLDAVLVPVQQRQHGIAQHDGAAQASGRGPHDELCPRLQVPRGCLDGLAETEAEEHSPAERSAEEGVAAEAAPLLHARQPEAADLQQQDVQQGLWQVNVVVVDGS
mmetsp:Transcript_76569/g.236471  ORF Transcript_76569/g.236471 Transcript_76569/m.236471 type:complete len:284 (+) Transcript_76569:305-1156(+)